VVASIGVALIQKQDTFIILMLERRPASPELGRSESVE